MTSISTISQAFKAHLEDVAVGFLVELKSPVRDDNPNTSLWLYQVTPDEFSRNGPPPTLQEASPGKPRQVGLRPLGVNLYFLVTPMKDDMIANHDEMTRLMLCIHDEPVIFVPKPLGGTDAIRISIGSESLEDRLRLWDSFKSKPYRLSFTCVLRTGKLQSSQVLTEYPVLSVGESLSGVATP